MRLRLLAWVIAFLLLSGTALALGLRPAQTKSNFVPEGEKEFVLKIINDEGKDLDLKANVEGTLARFVELEEKEYHIKADEEITEVKVKLKFPRELPPGESIADVVLEQDVTSLIGEEAGASISAKLQLVHKISVNAEIPEKFIKADVQYEDKGEQVEIITDVTNFGFKEINKLQSFLKVSEGDNEVKRLETNAVSLLPNESAKLKAVLDKTEVKEGEYTVAATIQYDEKRLIISKQLLVGEPKIDILRYDKYFVEKEVNDFKFDIKNNWNRVIERVTAMISINSNDKTETLASLPAFNISPLEEKTITTYIDLREFVKGDYQFAIKISYLNKTTEKTFEGGIVLESERDKRFIREQPRIVIPGESKAKIYLIVGLVIAVVLIVFALVMMQRAKGRRIREIESDW